MTEYSKNPKFRQLTAAAYDLFMQHGIRRVSIEEICVKSGVSKMAFYKYFRNKTELVIFLLDQLFSRTREEYRDIMAKQVPFPEKVKLILRLKNEQTKIMSHEFFRDIMRNPESRISSFIEKFKKEMFAEVLAGFKEARESGEIRSEIKPEFILYFLNHMAVMAEDETLLSLYESPNSLAMELTNFFFYGILPPAGEEEV